MEECRGTIVDAMQPFKPSPPFSTQDVAIAKRLGELAIEMSVIDRRTYSWLPWRRAKAMCDFKALGLFIYKLYDELERPREMLGDLRRAVLPIMMASTAAECVKIAAYFQEPNDEQEDWMEFIGLCAIVHHTTRVCRIGIR